MSRRYARFGGAAPAPTIVTGTTAGTVAAGNDSRIVGAAQKASNLGDLSDLVAARANLGMGSTGRPSDNYMLGWTIDPALCGSNCDLTLSEVYLQRIIPETSGTVNNIYFFVTSAGSTMTAGKNFVGLYDANGNKLGESADCSSAFTSTHVKKIPLLSGVAVTKGTVYYAAVLPNSTGTAPKLAGMSQAFWDLPNTGNGVANWASPTGPFNVTAPNRFRFMSWSVGVNTLPSTINLDNGNPDKALFMGIAT